MWDWEHTKLPDFKSISDIPLDSVDCTVNIAHEIFSLLESSNVRRSDIKEFTHQQKSEIDMLFRIFLWAVESLKKTCKNFGTEYDINKLNQLKFKINFFQKKIGEFWIDSWVVGEFDKRWRGIYVSCELYESSWKLLVEILKKAFKS